MDISGVASISNRTQHNRAKSSWSGRFLAECPIGELSEQEFRDRYYILESIFIRLSDGNNSSTHELPNNMIYFTKEQFVAGLRLLIPSLFVTRLLDSSKGYTKGHVLVSDPWSGSTKAPLTLVLGKHFVLKDLPFYEVSCLVDVKARQAPKKKTVIWPQVQEIMIESDELLEVEQTEWCETVELVVPPIIKEVEEEEMAANLL
ncbi:hypothetical protein CK203_058802 [Vitis vinifera]|uniref:Uncharacterized protein n=1 Tax=Vitis vinifera TaxID=29760 RepID=A0A438GGB2_VITVI|nr:hypothetical protein CK203_058802 [Vitis vinifera]